jgi:hypothetical protein
VSALDDLPSLPAPTPPPLSLLLEGELAQLRPVAPRRPMRQLALIVASSLIYGASVLAILTLRRDLHELPIGWMVGTGLAWLLGFVVPVYLATVPRAGAVMPRWKIACAAASIGALGFIALGLTLHPSGPSSASLGVARFIHGRGCLEFGLATAIVPVVVGAIFLRGALPVGSRPVAAALGAGGGSLGGLMLHLHCPITDALHVGVMHGGVVAIAAVLAVGLVPRTTQVR